jgi:hypothetical protein
MDFSILEDKPGYWEGACTNDNSELGDSCWETNYLLGVISQLVTRIEFLENNPVTKHPAAYLF